MFQKIIKEELPSHLNWHLEQSAQWHRDVDRDTGTPDTPESGKKARKWSDAHWPNSPNWASLVPLFREFSAGNNILGDRCCHWHWAILNSNNLWSWLLNMTAKNVRSFKVSRLNLESWFWTSWCGVIWEQAGVLYNYMNVDKYLVQSTSPFIF